MSTSKRRVAPKRSLPTTLQEMMEFRFDGLRPCYRRRELRRGFYRTSGCAKRTSLSCFRAELSRDFSENSESPAATSVGREARALSKTLRCHSHRKLASFGASVRSQLSEHATGTRPLRATNAIRRTAALRCLPVSVRQSLPMRSESPGIWSSRPLVTSESGQRAPSAGRHRRRTRRLSLHLRRSERAYLARHLHRHELAVIGSDWSP